MKKIFPILVLLCMTSVAMAQTPGERPPMPPGVHPGHPGMETTSMLKASYPDSTEFNAQFKELYPLIAPTPNVRERAETMLERMSRMFKAREIDSAKAYDSVMMALDPKADEKILHDAYREQFSAEELKSVVAFFKTPAGKHYLEAEQRLFAARNVEIDQYVHRTIDKVVAPMGKPMQPQPPGALRPGMRPGMPGQPPIPPPVPTTPKQ